MKIKFWTKVLLNVFFCCTIKKMNHIVKWASANDFQFSKNKNHYRLHFCRARTCDHSLNLRIQNTPLLNDDEAKYLVLIFEQKLIWGAHVNHSKQSYKKKLTQKTVTYNILCWSQISTKNIPCHDSTPNVTVEQ